MGRSSQCYTTVVTKAMVCIILSGMMHIKVPLLLIGKSSLCGGSGFPLLLSEWSFTICLTPYNCKYNVLSASINKTFPFFPSFPHGGGGGGPLSDRSFQPVLHDWINTGCGMCYPVYGMVHIKHPLVPRVAHVVATGFSLYLSEWSFTICLIKGVECFIK